MAESAAQKKAREKAEAAAAAEAAEKNQPHDASPEPGAEVDPAKAETAAQEQREQEQAKVLAAGEDKGEGGAATPAEKGAQTRAAADVVEQARLDAEARAGEQDAANEATKSAAKEAADAAAAAGGDDPVQAQRDAEAAAAAEGVEQSEEDRLLLAAAPGGQRTAIAGGKEGSTTVTHTAAQARPPLSGPLHNPVNDIENLAATEDDPDNRVYADEAGPRDDAVAGQYEAVFSDKEGSGLSYEDMFEDEEGKTFVTTKVRVYETFTFPNSVEKGRRLRWTAGKRVSRGDAEFARQVVADGSVVHTSVSG